MFHLQKRLIQAVVVIGANEDSGLVPLKEPSTAANSNDNQEENPSDRSIFDVQYRPHLLAVFTEEDATYFDKYHTSNQHPKPNYPPAEYRSLCNPNNEHFLSSSIWNHLGNSCSNGSDLSEFDAGETEWTGFQSLSQTVQSQEAQRLQKSSLNVTISQSINVPKRNSASTSQNPFSSAPQGKGAFDKRFGSVMKRTKKGRSSVSQAFHTSSRDDIRIEDGSFMLSSLNSTPTLSRHNSTRTTSSSYSVGSKSTVDGFCGSIVNGKSTNVSQETLDGLPKYLYPSGIQIFSEMQHPQIDYLVLTNINGERSHAMVLTYTRCYQQQKFPRHVNSNVNQTVLIQRCCNNTCSQLFIPTSIVLISNYAYFTLLKQILSLFHSVFLQQENEYHTKKNTQSTATANVYDPLDTLLSKFAAYVTNIATPRRGNLLYELCLFNHRLRIFPPLPVIDECVDFDLTIITKAFSQEDLLKLVCALLTQRRVVLISDNPVFTTLCCESLLLFIRPMEWRFTYVPWLPNNCIEFLEAPGPFLYGFHCELKEIICKAEDVICADLNMSEVLWNDTKPLPEPPKLATENLYKSLKTASQVNYEIATLCDLEPTNINDVRIIMSDHRRRQQIRILMAFMRFQVDCFRVVLNYIHRRSRTFNPTSMQSMKTENIFKREAFLKSQTESVEFYTEVVNAELFMSFLKGRFSHKADAWAKLEEATRHEMSLNSSALTSWENKQFFPESCSPNDDRRRSHRHFGSFHETFSLTVLPHIAEVENFHVLELPSFQPNKEENYFECLKNLLSQKMCEVSQEETEPHLQSAILFLRADTYSLMGRYEEAINDLHQVLKMGIITIKSSLIKNFIIFIHRSSVFDVKLLEHLERHLSKNTNLLELMQSCGIQESFISKIFHNDFRGDEENDHWEAILSRERVIKQVNLPMTPLSCIEFHEWCQLAEISYCYNVQNRLFCCLTLDEECLQESERNVKPEILSYFHQKWAGNVHVMEEDVKLLEDSEILIKMSPGLVRVDPLGTGRLFLTQWRLVFQHSGSKALHALCLHRDIVEIDKVHATNFLTRKNCSALKMRVSKGSTLKSTKGFNKATDTITSRPRQLQRPLSSYEISTLGASDGGFKTYQMWLKRETALWMLLLREIQAAHLYADEQRDRGVIKEAVDNCLLLDTFYSCCCRVDGNSDKMLNHLHYKNHSSHSAKTLSFPFSIAENSKSSSPAEMVQENSCVAKYFSNYLDKMQHNMASFTNLMSEESLNHSTSLTRQLLKWKVDPDPTNIYGKRVEAILGIRGSKGSHRREFWCLYNTCSITVGKLIVLEGARLHLTAVLLSLRAQLLCLVQCEDFVWVGSSDSRIYVLRISEKKLERKLVEHHDMVLFLITNASHQQRMYGSANNLFVVSATQKGHVVLWDAVSKKVLNQWSLGERVCLMGATFIDSQHAIFSLRNSLCISSVVTGESIYHVTPTTQTPSSLLPASSLSSIYVISDVWNSQHCPTAISKFHIFVGHAKNGVIQKFHLSFNREGVNNSNENETKILDGQWCGVPILCNIHESKTRAPCSICGGDRSNLCIKCKGVFSCHGISQLMVTNEIVLAACKDGNIFLFDLELNILSFHSTPFSSVQDPRGTIQNTRNNDTTNKFSDNPPYIQAHRGAVQSWCITDDDILITGGRDDNRVAMWNLDLLHSHSVTAQHSFGSLKCSGSSVTNSS